MVPGVTPIPAECPESGFRGGGARFVPTVSSSAQNMTWARAGRITHCPDGIPTSGVSTGGLLLCTEYTRLKPAKGIGQITVG